MTVIVGWTDGTHTWVGADRMYSNGVDPPKEDKKLLRLGNWTIGVSGESWAMVHMQMAHSDKTSPLRKAAASANPFKLALAIQATLKAVDYVPLDVKGDAPMFGVWAILAHKNGELWELYQDLRPYKAYPLRLTATGCGSQYARGAAWGMKGSKRNPGRAIVKHALAAACALHPHCGCGIDIVRAAP